MPVIPSFSAFAPKPNLAGAYGAGVGALQEQQQLAQAADRIMLEAQQLRQNYELERRRLNLAAETAMMENATKRDLAAADAAQEAQKLEIDKAYRTSMIGLQKAELDQRAQFETAKLEADAKEAADLFTKQQAYRQYADYLVENEGFSSEDAYRESALRYAPNFQGGGTMFSAALRPENETRETWQGAPPIQTAPTGEKFYQPYPGAGMQLIPEPEVSAATRLSQQQTATEIARDTAELAKLNEYFNRPDTINVLKKMDEAQKSGTKPKSDSEAVLWENVNQKRTRAAELRAKIERLQGGFIQPFGTEMGGPARAPAGTNATNRIKILSITPRNE